MIEIFHVSDFHFGESDYHNGRARSLLDKISNEYSFTEKNNRYLLITGDITQGGFKEEYDLAREALSPFPKRDRLFFTPGNHDYGCFFGTAYQEWKARYFDTPFASAFGFNHPFFNKTVFKRELKDESGNTLLIIGLNSVSKKGTIEEWDWAKGEIGESQRNELKDILAKSEAKTPKILFLHHIPNKDADWEPFMTLKDWEELMKVVRGKVDVLAFGHQGQLDIDYDRTRTWKALSRPMQVRSFDKVLRYDARDRPITVLDANASVKEQACYLITWNGTQPQPEAKVIDFGH